jgi:ABC-type Zn2+ transport system substrate-binding protein/surface adhesin
MDDGDGGQWMQQMGIAIVWANDQGQIGWPIGGKQEDEDEEEADKRKEQHRHQHLDEEEEEEEHQGKDMQILEEGMYI